MYLLGHVGLTIFLLFAFQKILKTDYSKFFVFAGLGSMLPDIIDKPIGSILFGTGRWFGHSLIFLTLIFAIPFFLLKEQKYREMKIKNILTVLYIGSLAHLIEDGRGLSRNVILWPFHGSIPNGSQGDFLHGFEDTFTVFFEILGALLLVIIGLSEKWDIKQWRLLLLMMISYLLLFFITYLLIVGF
ncbi:MAG: hypothetical protein HeimC2_18880 [Candidatus Heimdallarchaeota archaeon LC_2]|nr:MAG: hypothetical protein HeimC2_18880 [Candidatus Heimdallarchaeota archaeon LC_2]